MLGELEKRLQAVDRKTLNPFVRSILKNERADVVTWQVQPVEGGFGRSYGVFQFQGEAQASGDTMVWSLILKIAGPALGERRRCPPERNPHGY
jgi:hypothetical protein